jgi:predicted HicB family RNase H-like nuclease
MARPRIYDGPRVTTAVRLTPEMRDELHKAAGAAGVSVNQLVVSTLSDYLGNLPRRRRSSPRKTS